MAVEVWSPQTPGWKIIQRFGQNNFFPRNPYWPLKAHGAIDVLVPDRTPAYALDAGVVTFAGLDANTDRNPAVGYGFHVDLAHTWGRSRYAHFGAIGVRLGGLVKPGDELGMCDNTGFSDITHLHFAVGVIAAQYHAPGFGDWVDPMQFLPPSLGGAGLEPPRPVRPLTPDAIQLRIERVEAQKLEALDLGADAIQLVNRVVGRFAGGPDQLPNDWHDEYTRLNEFFHGRAG